jgi:hypothetical protein
VVVIDLQFSRVFNGEKATVPWDVHAETIEGRGLTRTCTACDDKVSRAAVKPFNPNPHHSSKPSVYGSELDEINHGERIFLELSNG